MSSDQYNALQEKLAQSRFCDVSMLGELECISVTHPDFSARLLTQGAQLLNFCVQGQDWIWLSEDAEYKRGISVRGGIPVCWPWFGDAKKNPQAVNDHIRSQQPPAHGLARSSDWQLKDCQETDSEVVLTLTLALVPSEHWNTEVSAELRISFSATTLRLQLTTTAGDEAVNFTQALHTYFPTTDIRQTWIGGFDKQAYIDALDEWSEKVQQGRVEFMAETDRIYQVPGAITLETPTQTLLLKGNNRTAVVWNPWIEKSTRLGQFADDAWQRMFCVESANVLNDAVHLQPGQSHTLEMVLSPAPGSGNQTK